MASLRVLAIVFLTFIAINAAQGLSLEDNRNLCSAPRVTIKDKTFDSFCMGVKNSEVKFPEGTGCLKDINCDHIVAVYASTEETLVKWESSKNVLLVLSHAKTSTTSKKGEVYKLPANVVAIGQDSAEYKVRLTDNEGKEGETDENCVKYLVVKVKDIKKVFGLVSGHKLDCKFNGFKADLYKDELYATLVVMDNKGNFVAEYHLDKAVVLLGRGKGLSGWAIAGIVIGVILLVVALIGGVVYYVMKKKKSDAQATPAVDEQT